jgi:putative membrane protein
MQAPLAHWLLSWPVLACYAVFATAHLAGLRRLLADARPAGSASAIRAARLREAAVFQAGLAVVLLALVSPVAYWAPVSMWLRGIQDLMLALAGPGLIVLGAPWQPLRAAWPRGRAAADRPAAAADRAMADRPAVAAAGGWLSWPLAAAVAFNVAWIGWQLPGLYDASRAGPLAWLEHASYLAAGTAFWLALIGSRPCRPALPPLRRFGLVAATVAADTVLGMVLAFGAHAMYPGYAAAAARVMPLLDDQQLTGAVLWMGALPPLVIAGIAIMMQWLSEEESAELSGGLDRLLRPRRSSWPSRPGLR